MKRMLLNEKKASVGLNDRCPNFHNMPVLPDHSSNHGFNRGGHTSLNPPGIMASNQNVIIPETNNVYPPIPSVAAQSFPGNVIAPHQPMTQSVAPILPFQAHNSQQQLLALHVLQQQLVQNNQAMMSQQILQAHYQQQLQLACGALVLPTANQQLQPPPSGSINSPAQSIEGLSTANQQLQPPPAGSMNSPAQSVAGLLTANQLLQPLPAGSISSLAQSIAGLPTANQQLQPLPAGSMNSPAQLVAGLPTANHQLQLLPVGSISSLAQSIAGLSQAALQSSVPLQANAQLVNTLVNPLSNPVQQTDSSNRTSEHSQMSQFDNGTSHSQKTSSESKDGAT